MHYIGFFPYFALDYMAEVRIFFFIEAVGVKDMRLQI